MSRYITHEIIIYDRGALQRVALRSSCQGPYRKIGMLCDTLYREDALPPNVAEVLIPLMDMQDEALERAVGAA